MNITPARIKGYDEPLILAIFNNDHKYYDFL